MELTSRERLMKTLRREPVDRVPVSTYELLPMGYDPWYESQESYRELLAFIERYVDILYLWDRPATNKCTWDESNDYWHEGDSTYQRYTLHTPKGPLSRVTRRDKSINTTWTVEPLFKSLEDVERYLALPWEFDGVDMSGFSRADERLGDRGIVLCDTMDPVCAMAYGFDFEPFLVYAWQDRKRMKYCMDAILERLSLEIQYKMERGAGPIWRIYGPEYITPPYFPTEAFRELVVAYDKPLIELIHEYGGYARIHSHGNVRDILDLIVEMEADAIDPLEPPPQGNVDLEYVKKNYGDRLILFGNIELSFLEYWEGAEIERYVRDSIDQAAEGGGYVVMPTAAPINAPLWKRTEDNYKRFIETAIEYGRYDR